ncbi:MAG: hypothetical protein ACE5MI_00660 [Acidimicrobiia bacterium]
MTDRKRPLRIPLTVTPPTGTAKAAEASDPYQPVAFGVPTPGHDGLEAMARTFIAEFALLGWPRSRIARMFRIPRYVAAHTVYRQRGPVFVEELLDDVLGPEGN